MKKYLLIRDAAERLGVSKYTLYGWDKSRRFVPAKVDQYTKTRLYSIEQIDEFIEEHGASPKFKRGPKTLVSKTLVSKTLVSKTLVSKTLVSKKKL